MTVKTATAEAFDLTHTFESAGRLAGVDAKTVKRYVALGDEGADPFGRARRLRLVDPFVEKIEELVERSDGRIRADVVHARLVGLGFAGDERTARRAVAEAKTAFGAGHRRVYRQWMPEPGLWLQWDWGEGPRLEGRRTSLFCAWLAWSRFRSGAPSSRW